MWLASVADKPICQYGMITAASSLINFPETFKILATVKPVVWQKNSATFISLMRFTSIKITIAMDSDFQHLFKLLKCFIQSNNVSCLTHKLYIGFRLKTITRVVNERCNYLLWREKGDNMGGVHTKRTWIVLIELLTCF